MAKELIFQLSGTEFPASPVKRSLKVINVPAKMAKYYKKRLPEKLHPLIVELPED